MSVDRGNMSADSEIENANGKRDYINMGTYGGRVDRQALGDMPTNPEDYLPYRKYPTNVEVARLCGAMGARVRLPSQFIGRVFNPRGLLPTSLFRVDDRKGRESTYQEDFWPKEIFYRLGPVKKAGLWTPVFPRKSNYFPLFLMQEAMEQNNASGSGDWLASCLPQRLQHHTALRCHGWDVVPWMLMGGVSSLKTNTESVETVTINIDKWKQFFWQMSSIPTSLRPHNKLEVDFTDNTMNAVALKTENEFGKSDIPNYTYTMEEAYAARSARFFEKSITVNLTDHKRDSGDKQSASGKKQKLSVKKRLVRAFRRLFCCALKD